MTEPASKPVLNLHSILDCSRGNGPGLRSVIWFQGCTLGCPGCFNPDTHADQPRISLGADDLVTRLLGLGEAVQGVSLTGGEPFEQPEGLYALVSALRNRTELSLLIFSGHSRGEILRMPLGEEILLRTDVLIAGRYLQRRHLGRRLLGSSNQKIHLLSGRYSLRDFDTLPELEVQIDGRGGVVITGVAPAELEPEAG